MKYENIISGIFLSRPNRFVAQVMVDDGEVTAHVKNTGRCKELLVPDAKVYLEDFSNKMGTRKLKYSVIGVRKMLSDGRELMINIDSQAPNKVVYEALAAGTLKLPHMSNIEYIKPEMKFGNSRLDFYVRDTKGKEGYIEVKGVTLENDGIASFPDAPTERGIKHLNELAGLAEKGLNAYVIFVIQMKGMNYFTPNTERHPQFAEALRKSKESGVNILAHQCIAEYDSLVLDKEINVIL